MMRTFATAALLAALCGAPAHAQSDDKPEPLRIRVGIG